MKGGKLKGIEHDIIFKLKGIILGGPPLCGIGQCLVSDCHPNFVAVFQEAVGLEAAISCICSKLRALLFQVMDKLT